MSDKNNNIVSAESESNIAEQKKDTDKKKLKKILLIVVPSVVLLAAVILLTVFVFIPSSKYKKAMKLYESGDYGEASAIFCDLNDMFYKDSGSLWAKSYYYDNYSDKRIIDITFFNGGIVCLTEDGDVFETHPETYKMDKGAHNSDKEVYDWMDITAISANYSTIVGLKSDGTVVIKYTGDKTDRYDVSGWNNITSVSVGDYFIAGLKSDGTVIVTSKYDYDLNDYKIRMSDWASDWNDITAISAKGHTLVGLKSDGTVVAVGENDAGQCNVSEWKNIIAVSAGGTHTVGLKSDGTVVATNYLNSASDYEGECIVSDWKNIKSVSAGTHFTIGVKTDGTLVYAGNERLNPEFDEKWNSIDKIFSENFWEYGNDYCGIREDGMVVDRHLSCYMYLYS